MTDGISELFDSPDQSASMANMMAKKITERRAGKASSELGGPSPEELFKDPYPSSFIPYQEMTTKAYDTEDDTEDETKWVIGFYIPNPIYYGIDKNDVYYGTITELDNNVDFLEEADLAGFSFSDLFNLEQQDLNKDLTVLALTDVAFEAEFGFLPTESYSEQFDEAVQIRKERLSRAQESKSIEEQTLSTLKQILVELKKK